MAEMFLDRDEVEWGDQWEQQIENALGRTVFFIPIVTPRYFTRPECRKELLTFVGRAESLGLSELLLPILSMWRSPIFGRTIPMRRKQSSRGLSTLIGRKLRVAGPDSREYREGVNRLAQRLAGLTATVAARQLEREAATAEREDSEAPGLSELIDQIDALLPEWLAAVQADPLTEAQHVATMRHFNERLAKLRRSGPPRGAIFALLTRMAKEDLPLAERHLQYAKTYAAKTVELDPLVHAAVRSVEEYPAGVAVLDELRQAVAEAMEVIERGERELLDNRYRMMTDVSRDYRNVSRLWRKLEDVYSRAEVLAGEGNALVVAWSERLQALPDQEAVEPSE